MKVSILILILLMKPLSLLNNLLSQVIALSAPVKRAGACGGNAVIDASQTKDPVAAFVEQTGSHPRLLQQPESMNGESKNE
jgi:hypothetical protein